MKTFNIFSKEKNTNEYTVLKIKSPSYEEALLVFEKDYKNYSPIQCVYPKFNSLYKQYRKLYEKIKSVGYDQLKELFDEIPHIDECFIFSGKHYCFEDLSVNGIVISDELITLYFYDLNEFSFKNIINWLQEIVDNI